MIVPSCLVNGKQSTCAPKNIVVYFKDVATTNMSNETHGNKKAMASHYLYTPYVRTGDKHLILDNLIMSVLIFEAKLFSTSEMHQLA